MPRKKGNDEEWGRHRAELKSLYLDEDKSLKEVQAHMEASYGFVKTKSQYSTQFKKWNFKKNADDAGWKFISKRLQKRKLDGKEASEVYMNGSLVPEKKLKKEISRHVPLSSVYACSPEAQTPDGIVVATPAAAAQLCAPDLQISHPSSPQTTARIHAGASREFDILPCFQFQDLLLEKFNFEAQYTDISSSVSGQSSLGYPSLSSLFSDVILGPTTVNSDFDCVSSSRKARGLKGRSMFDTNALDMEFFPRVGLVPESSIQEAQAMLSQCLRVQGVGSPLPIIDNVDNVTSSLEPFMIQQPNQDLELRDRLLFGSSKSRTLLHLFHFYVYLCSNNMMSEDKACEILRWLTEQGFRDVLKVILELDSIAVEAFASTLLRSAIQEEDYETARMLIEAGVKIDNPSGSMDVQTVLHEAIDVADVHIIQMLLDAGANPNVGADDDTPLTSAVRNQSLALVRMLLDAGADPNYLHDSAIDTPLQCAIGHNICPEDEQLEIVRLLLDAKADPNASVSPEDPKPLQLACLRYNAKLTGLLIRAGADIEVNQNSGSQLDGSTYDDTFDTFDLLDDVSEIEERDYYLFLMRQTPIQIAAENENWEAVNMLVEAGALTDSHLSKLKKWELKTVLRVNHGLGDIAVFSPLQAAVKAGKFAIVTRLLISAGARVDGRPRNNHGYTALQIAALTQNETGVRMLLQIGADINAPAGPLYGCTALQAAARNHDRADLLIFLLESGANVNAPACAGKGRTALQAAALAGNLDAVRILIAAGADVNAPPGRNAGITALQAATMSPNASEALEIVELLLDASADVNAAPAYLNGVTALESAVQYGRFEVVERLLKAGADVVNPRPDQPEHSALLKAIQNENIELTTLLLMNGANPNISPPSTDKGLNPLQEAASQGNMDLIRLLLRWGADVNAPASMSGGLTALQAAAKRSLPAVKLLYEAGANINAPWAYYDGSSALHSALKSRNIEIVKFLLERGAALDVPAYLSKVGILGLAIRNRSINDSLVEMLVQAGATLNSRMHQTQGLYFYESPLHVAIEGCKLHLIKVLLKAGADVNGCAKKGLKDRMLTPLHVAIEARNIDIVRLLVDHGAGIDLFERGPFANDTALQDAVAEQSSDITKYLLEKGADVNAPPGIFRRRTALQEAAIKGDIQLTQLLLDRGADVNAPAASDRGVTALQGAAISGNIRLVVMLLTAGADINTPASSWEGRTAIEGAAEHGRLDTVHILLNRHPRIEGLELELERAAELANRNGHFAIAKYIEDYKRHLSNPVS